MHSFEGVKFVVAGWWGVQDEGEAQREVGRTSGGTSSECLEINYSKLASAKEAKACMYTAYISIYLSIYLSICLQNSQLA